MHPLKSDFRPPWATCRLSGWILIWPEVIYQKLYWCMLELSDKLARHYAYGELRQFIHCRVECLSVNSCAIVWVSLGRELLWCVYRSVTCWSCFCGIEVNMYVDHWFISWWQCDMMVLCAGRPSYCVNRSSTWKTSCEYLRWTVTNVSFFLNLPDVLC